MEDARLCKGVLPARWGREEIQSARGGSPSPMALSPPHLPDLPLCPFKGLWCRSLQHAETSDKDFLRQEMLPAELLGTHVRVHSEWSTLGGCCPCACFLLTQNPAHGPRLIAVVSAWCGKAHHRAQQPGGAALGVGWSGVSGSCCKAHQHLLGSLQKLASRPRHNCPPTQRRTLLALTQPSVQLARYSPKHQSKQHY